MAPQPHLMGALAAEAYVMLTGRIRMEVRFRLIVGALIVSGLACRAPRAQAAAAEPAIVVEGQVLAEATGAPVMGARVRLDADTSRSVTTDRDGRYRFANVPRAQQTLSVRAIGYIPESREIRPSCTVSVSAYDERGRVVTPARCTPSPERLDFRLRPETVY